MDLGQFWETIAELNRTARWDMAAKEEGLRDALWRLSPPEIVGFWIHFNQHLDCLENRRMNSAVFLLGVGCGDSGWHDFCASLIMMGRDIYWSTNRDPDSLVDLLAESRDPHLLEHEGYTSVISDALEDCVPAPLQIMPELRSLGLTSAAVPDDRLPEAFPKIWAFVSARR